MSTDEEVIYKFKKENGWLKPYQKKEADKISFAKEAEKGRKAAAKFKEIYFGERRRTV